VNCPDRQTSGQYFSVKAEIDRLQVVLPARARLGCQVLRQLFERVVRPLATPHWAVRSLMVQAAQREGISPLRLSFTGTLNVLRRAVAKLQRGSSDELPLVGVG
jgi:hypothetical protein